MGKPAAPPASLLPRCVASAPPCSPASPPSYKELAPTTMALDAYPTALAPSLQCSCRCQCHPTWMVAWEDGGMVAWGSA